MELTGRTVPMRLLAPVLGPAGGLLGAGLAALAAAHELMRRDYEVSVLEAQDCPGGRGQNCSRPALAQRSYRYGRRADLDSHRRGIGWVDASAWPFGKVVQVKIRFAADAVWERLRSLMPCDGDLRSLQPTTARRRTAEDDLRSRLAS
jgi:hypothetical protein